MKTAILVKLQAEWYQGMPAVIWSSNTLPSCLIYTHTHTELYFCQLFRIGVILILVSYNEDHTLWMFENRMLIEGASWSALLMKYLHDKLRMNWTGYMASIDRRGAYRVLVDKPEGETPHRGHRQRQDHTKIRIFVLFCTMTNQCTINWQIILLLLQVSTMLCHPQAACS